MQPKSDRPEATAASRPAPTVEGQPGAVAAAAAGRPGDSGPREEVAALLAGLDALDGRPLAKHVEVFEQVHGRLQAALREIDNA